MRIQKIEMKFILITIIVTVTSICEAQMLPFAVWNKSTVVASTLCGISNFTAATASATMITIPTCTPAASVVFGVIQAWGAGGGSSKYYQTGGAAGGGGGYVKGMISVLASDLTLTYLVGGGGGGGGLGGTAGIAGGGTGSPGSWQGGGGGGRSAVLQGGIELLTAGGGGGAGGCYSSLCTAGGGGGGGIGAPAAAYPSPNTTFTAGLVASGKIGGNGVTTNFNWSGSGAGGGGYVGGNGGTAGEANSSGGNGGTNYNSDYYGINTSSTGQSAANQSDPHNASLVAGRGGVTTTGGYNVNGASGNTGQVYIEWYSIYSLAFSSPAAGYVQTLPTTVTVSFSMVPSTVPATISTNYSLLCGATPIAVNSAIINTADISGRTVELGLAADRSMASPGVVCKLTVSSNVVSASASVLPNAVASAPGYNQITWIYSAMPSFLVPGNFTYTVPDSCGSKTTTIELWGGGGGSGSNANSPAIDQPGGGGGYASYSAIFTPGTILSLTLGSGGQGAVAFNASGAGGLYGQGGNGAITTYSWGAGGGGGGYSSVMQGAVLLAMAGGGGGGGNCFNASCGTTNYGGAGGGGVGTGGDAAFPGSPGAGYAGGNASTANNGGGGGGGGGYAPGKGGQPAPLGAPSQYWAGGGYGGTNFGTITTTGSGTTPGHTTGNYISGAGVGGAYSPAANQLPGVSGKDGLIVITCQ